MFVTAISDEKSSSKNIFASKPVRIERRKSSAQREIRANLEWKLFSRGEMFLGHFRENWKTGTNDFIRNARVYNALCCLCKLVNSTTNRNYFL